MSPWWQRADSAPALPVSPGERLLAWAVATDGALAAGTRDALYLVAAAQEAHHEPTRIPWEQVQAADWDRESEVLRVSEVGDYGTTRPVHQLRIEEPQRLLELVRERVTASVVLQRHVTVSGRRGFRVIARRAPGGQQPVRWFCEFDRDIDPDQPAVRALATAALAAARDELGDL